MHVNAMERGDEPVSPGRTDMGAFQVWLRAYGGGDPFAGMRRLADELGCAPMTVQFWYYRRGLPKSAWLHTILTLAGGELTFEDVVESTRKPANYVPMYRKKKKP